MLKYLQENKIAAVVVAIIIILILYFKFGRKEKASNKKDRGTSGKSRKSGKNVKSGKNGKNGKSKPSKRRSNDEENPRERQTVNFHNDIDSESSDASEDDDLREDAEELYNLVHEDMCSGMQQSEFEQAVDDLADTFIFIELRQLYNQCIEKNMDPDRSITVEDYVKILKREE